MLWSKKERNYIEEVLNYEAQHKRDHSGKNGYEPIVAKLLLSIFIRLGDLLVVLSALIGLFLLCIFKLR